VGYTKTDIEALADEQLRAVLLPGAPAALTPSSGPALDLQLSWWVRPPATFQLSIPFMPDVRADKERRDHIVALLRRMLDRARAAGVRAALDLPEPTHTDQHELGTRAFSVEADAKFQERAGATTSELSADAAAKLEERHSIGEGQFSFQGVFDVTRFEGSRFAP
jgi:hypothetical protein